MKQAPELRTQSFKLVCKCKSTSTRMIMIIPMAIEEISEMFGSYKKLYLLQR